MKKPEIAIAIVTIYLIVFQLALYMDIDIKLLFSILSLSPFFIMYMVFVILKYGKPSKYNFDERFYDDRDYIRNGKEELEV